MSTMQLAAAYAKMPRVQYEYDSDDEPANHPIQSPPQEATKITKLTKTTTDCAVVNLTAAFLDAESVDDIYIETALEFGVAYSPTDKEHEDHATGANPDSMVQDPFNPMARCTLKEADDLLQEEQQYRRSHGMPLLVQNPHDSEHWIDPWEIHEGVRRDPSAIW